MIEFLQLDIGKILKNRAMNTPEKDAVITETCRYSWKELDVLSDYIAEEMQNNGVSAGEYVGLLGINSFDWIIHFLAISKVGGISVLFNTRFRDVEIEHCVKLTGVEKIYYSKNYEGCSYKHLLDKISNEKKIGNFKRAFDITKKQEEWKSLYDDLISRKYSYNAVENVDIHGTAAVIFTSGTTGRSKGVELSHYSLINNSNAIKTNMRWNDEDVMCVSVPLFHSFGVTGCILAMILSGGAMYLAPSTRSVDICSVIEREKCTIMNGVPTMFLAMLKNKERKNFDLSSLKSGLIAGSPIFPQDYKDILSMFENMNLQPSYGQTETSPCVTICRLDDSVEMKSQTVGRTIDGVEIRTCKKGSITPCGYNVEGEIQVRGYNVMRGYVNDEEASKSVFTEDGWLRSGDLGYIREDGNLVVTGRIKNLIIRGGENISPLEIENEIKKLIGSREVKVFGVPTLVLQEDIAACIEGVGSEEEKNRILNALSEKISDYKVPKHLFFMEEMPRNSTGKINEVMVKDRVIAEVNSKRRCEINLKHNLL